MRVRPPLVFGEPVVVALAAAAATPVDGQSFLAKFCFRGDIGDELLMEEAADAAVAVADTAVEGHFRVWCLRWGLVAERLDGLATAATGELPSTCTDC